MTGAALWLDALGNLKPRYMTDGEIKLELQVAEGKRWTALATEMRDRERARAAHVEELTRRQRLVDLGAAREARR